LKWLERNSQDCSKIKSSSRVSINERVSDFKRHKSVENVKEYCLQKLLGKLNTKHEMRVLSQQSLERQRLTAESEYHSRYDQAKEEIRARR
jgi:hypothetical protein